MKKNANGIHPAAAILLTAAAAFLTIHFFKGSHAFWGIVFALITVDFLADAVLSFKKA